MSKKMILAALVALLCLPAYAEEGGFKAGETPPPPHKQDAGYKGTEDTGQSTIKSIRKMDEGSWVTLEGNIIKKLGAESYSFRDKTGTVKINVPKSVWKGEKYDSQDLVRINGRVEGKGDKTIINVKELGVP